MAPRPLKKSRATVSDDDGDDPLNMHDIQYDFEGSQIEDDEDDEVTLLPSSPTTVPKKRKRKDKGKLLSDVWGDCVLETRRKHVVDLAPEVKKNILSSSDHICR